MRLISRASRSFGSSCRACGSPPMEWDEPPKRLNDYFDYIPKLVVGVEELDFDIVEFVDIVGFVEGNFV